MDRNRRREAAAAASGSARSEKVLLPEWDLHALDAGGMAA
jgi:hypothetical protein